MLNLAVTNLGKYNEGKLIFEWLELPCTDEEMKEVLNKIGINNQYEEYFISDYETDFDIKINEYDSILDLNKAMKEYEALKQDDKLKIKAELEIFEYSLQKALDHKDYYNLYTNIRSYCDLGRMYFNEGFYNIPEHIYNYIDFEMYGKDNSVDGDFSSYGYIERI